MWEVGSSCSNCKQVSKNPMQIHIQKGLFIGESKWQPLNGSRRMVRKERKRTAKNGQKQSAQKVRKRAQKCKNGRKQAKKGETMRKRSGCFLFVFFAIFRWPYSGGHSGFSYLHRVGCSVCRLSHIRDRNQNGKATQKGSFRPDIPADIPMKHFGQPIHVLEGHAFCYGHPAWTCLEEELGT